MKGYKLIRKISKGYQSFLNFFYFLGKKYVGKGFYVWPDLNTATNVLEFIRTKRAECWHEFYGYPIQEVVITEVEFDKVVKKYKEWNGSENFFPALRVENLTILREIPSHLFDDEIKKKESDVF